MKRNQVVNILKVQHFKGTIPKFKPCLKKNWRFYNAWKLCEEWSTNRAAKASSHVAWWRSVANMYKTTRLQCDTACIGYTQHQYPRRFLKIQRKHSIQNRSTCPPRKPLILSDKMNCAINSSPSPDHVSKIEQFLEPKSWLNFYFVEL